ncbi:MAG TPA: NAD-dependent deacylase [Longimicrobiales bacterium]|nr:NAD-dependent deacylase [Longimicrobiales bacterium]
MDEVSGGAEHAESVARGRALLAEARRILVLTGAGISADSGVPTFRGPGGLWKRRRPEELATPQAFRSDPRLVWEWYAWRRERVRSCAPSAGHLALARWARSRPGITLVTQNVDGLHEAAARQLGAAPADAPAAPLELHGSLFRVRCTACGAERPHREPVDASAPETLPRCETCGGLLRPAVVWFGEPLPRAVLERALEAAARADACLVVGTSGVVYPAAGLATEAVRGGAALVEVNPEPTPLSLLATVTIRAGSAATLPELLGA